VEENVFAIAAAIAPPSIPTLNIKLLLILSILAFASATKQNSQKAKVSKSQNVASL
jgi:hypothetical protein